MATKFQIKRTSVSGRTPNTADPANTSYIASGELAVNLTDQKLYSSNGTAAFEVGANLTNLVVTDNITANQLVLTTPLIEKYSSTVTYVVTIANKTSGHRYNGVGSSQGYIIDGFESPYLTLLPGKTYRFDQSDASNLTHPLRFYVDADKTKQFTDGVTTSGTAGNAGAYTEIAVSANTPATLHYQCSAHAKMGNQIQVLGSTAADSILVYGNATINVIVANGATGTAGKFLTSNSLGGVYWANSPGITVELTNSTSNVTTLTTVNTLQFDENSGFNIVNVATGTAKVEINSTFKFWQVNGVQKLTATGLDTVNFIGGNNISITANGANTPQSIAFATSMTPTFTSVTFGNSTVNTTINSSAIAVTKIFANGVIGTAGKVLTSNGTGGIYWGDASSGGGGGDLTIISDTFNGNGSNTIFTLSVSTSTDKTFVYLNGVLQTPTTDYSVTGTTLTFVAAPPSDNVIEVRSFDIPSVADLTVTSDNFTGNGSNTQFTLTTSQSSNETSLVFLNGVAQVPTADYSISGSTLTFTAAPAAATNIQVTSYTAEDIVTTTYTGNGSNTQFTLGTTSTTTKTVVSLNGVTQTPTADYSVSGATLVFSVAPANNDKIIARAIPSTASSTAGSNTNIQYNKSGSLGGSAGFTFNETTNNVTIANTLTVPNLRINASNPPANSTSTGATGTIAWDSGYIYVAVGTNTWKKIAISETGAAGGGGGSGLVRDSFTGNGSNVNFTLSKEPANEAQTLVFVDRVLQRDADYSLSGTTLTFASAPDNSAEIDVYISDPATTEVAGANTNIIFNDSDFANGSAAFTFNKATNTVALSNTLTVGSNLTINTSAIFIGNSTVNTTIIAGNVDLQGTQLRVGNVVVNGNQITIGNSTVNSVINSAGVALAGNATFSGHLMPSANITYDIGNSAMRWRDLWLSGTTINLGGATIQTDTDTGAIALIPKPTEATPNPVAVVVSPTGGITTVTTTAGVPAANAVAAAAVANTATPVPIDVTTSAPANGQALIWSSSANTFIPGNVAAGGASSDIPKITGLIYPSDDTAANTSGGQTVYIRGSNFAANCTVYINGTAVPSVSFISSSNVGFTTPALSANVYPVYVINPGDGATAIHIPGLNISGVPSWSTAAGSLGNADSGSAWSFSVAATSDSSVTYALAGGSSLPSGISLASNGLISGTLSSPPASETTYNFSVVATDLENQDASRSFSVVVTVADPYFYLTTLLLHGDGTNNKNNHTFLDSSNNNFTITRNGNATQGSFSPFSQTGWGNYFDGTGDFLDFPTSSAFTMGTGDFTIELWYYPSVNYVSGNGYLFDLGSNGTRVQLFNNQIYFAPVAGSGVTGAAGVGVLARTWYHLACVRSGSTITVYLNGTSIGSASNSSNLTDNDCRIGEWGGGTAGPFNGYMSNLRIVKGTAVYTSNFTPSLTPLTAITNTSLLTCQSNRFIDNSTNNFTITRNGDVSVQPFSPFAPTAAYTTANVGGSAYFDGTGDYLTVPDNVALESFTDFTIEFWVYFNSVSGTQVVVDKGWNGTSFTPYLIMLSSGSLITYASSGSSWDILSGSSFGTMAVGQWYHIALTRSGSSIRLFTNGSLITTVTNSTTLMDSASVLGVCASPSAGANPLNGYLSGLRIVKGTAVYTSAFTLPTAPPTNIANTALLLNSTNAGIFDQTAKNVFETVGDAKISTSVYKYGTGSIAFDGSGDRLYKDAIKDPLSDLGINSEPFTVEQWVYFNTVSGAFSFSIGKGGGTAGWNSSSGHQYLFGIMSSGSLYIQVWNGSSITNINVSNPFSTGQWYHYAVTYDGTTTKVFVNGSQVLSGNITYAKISNPTRFVVGDTPAYDAPFNGYIDDLRVTKGYARYTSNFTPPTSAFKDR